jgi:hypothetical protein
LALLALLALLARLNDVKLPPSEGAPGVLQPRLAHDTLPRLPGFLQRIAQQRIAVGRVCATDLTLARTISFGALMTKPPRGRISDSLI